MTFSTSFFRPYVAKPAHPKVVLRTETGDIRFTLPWAPREIDHDGMSPEYKEVPRAGDEPYLVLGAKRLRGMTLQFTLATIGRQSTSVESSIRLLERIANSSQRVYLAYGPTEGGLWRIMDMSVSSISRKHGTNEITAATVNLTMKRNISNVINLGPVTNKPKPATPTTTTTTTKTATPVVKPATTTTTVRYHTVKSGETLSGISLLYYKTASKWPLIASANSIKNANLIYPGQRLRIP